MSTEGPVTETPATEAGVALDGWVREIIAWHFDPATGCPFWLDFASRLTQIGRFLVVFLAFLNNYVYFLTCL